VEDLGLSRRLVFGKGLTDTAAGGEPPTKRLIVNSARMAQVLDMRILFENLYTY